MWRALGGGILGAVLLVGSVQAQETPPLLYDPNGPDRDCSDFPTWDEANAFFLAAGGPDRDPHRLDADRNGTPGIPCESLDGSPVRRGR